MTLLPVRPKPQITESLYGYIERLAAANGWLSGSLLMRSQGFTRPIHAHAQIQRVIDWLQERTGHVAEISEQNFLPDRCRSFGRDEQRVFRSLKIGTPRVCPACLADAPIHQSYWQYLPYTHCRVHATPLIGACPSCRRTFSWSASLLSQGCPSCGLPWQPLHEEGGALPLYQADFEALASDTERGAYLRDLSVAIRRALRPYDGMIDVAEYPPASISSWSDVLSRGYSMLSEPAFIERWLGSLAHARPCVSALGAAARLRPVTSMVHRLERHWPVKQFTCAVPPPVPDASLLPSFALSHLPSRNQGAAQSGLDESLRFHEDMHGLSAILGCSGPEVTQLLETGFLDTVNGARLSRDAVFDLRTLAAHLPYGSVRDGMAPLRSHGWMLPLYAANWADVLAGVFDGRLGAGVGPGGDTLLESIVVSPFRLRCFLTRHLRKKAGDDSVTLTAQEVSALLCLPQRCLPMLARANLLTPLAWQRGSDRYRLGDAVRLMRTHWILPRWLKLTARASTPSQQFFRQLGLRPVLGLPLCQSTPDLRPAVRQWIAAQPSRRRSRPCAA